MRAAVTDLFAEPGTTLTYADIITASGIEEVAARAVLVTLTAEKALRVRVGEGPGDWWGMSFRPAKAEAWSPDCQTV